MILFIVSFVAGFLSVLAPCVLPLLPVTLGSSMGESSNKLRPFIIIGSLSLSVFVFTLLLKGSTALVGGSISFWSYISAAILAVFGLSLLFPIWWAKVMLKLPGHRAPESWMAKGYQSRGHWWADVLVGAALGPVFTTCSPTFFVILATVLPQSFGKGIVDLLAYVVGLAIALLLISWVGQRLVDRLEWAADPNGAFRKVLGILFLAVALAIATGYDKTVESAILNSGIFDITTVEQALHQKLEGAQGGQTSLPQGNMASSSDSSGAMSPGDMSSSGGDAHPGGAAIAPKGAAAPAGGVEPTDEAMTIQKIITTPISGEHNLGRYVEIAKPAGFVNTGGAPIKLADFVGKKVILVDFIDYSCINCERTFPYMKDWWAKYKDQGLEIIAFHTPEFSFEKDQANVEAAAKQFGLTFPIVLDNDYATWNAYGNEYWPHKYIIDIHGNVVYDHIGEGEYDLTEQEIVKQLTIRKQVLGEPGLVSKTGAPMPPAPEIQAASPETYFGAARNERFGNGTPGTVGTQTLTAPAASDSLTPNIFYLGGSWDLEKEYAQTVSASSTLSYEFTASKMYIVAETADGKPATATILVDGKPIADNRAGADVKGGMLLVNGSRLYNIFSNQTIERHRIDIIFSRPGVRAYTFTFG